MTLVFQEYERWTDAFNTYVSFSNLKCKSLFEEFFFDLGKLGMGAAGLTLHPQYIGLTYKRLAMLFLQEAQENAKNGLAQTFNNGIPQCSGSNNAHRTQPSPERHSALLIVPTPARQRGRSGAVCIGKDWG